MLASCPMCPFHETGASGRVGLDRRDPAPGHRPTVAVAEGSTASLSASTGLGID
jgi:hypothetical protein